MPGPRAVRTIRRLLVLVLLALTSSLAQAQEPGDGKLAPLPPPAPAAQEPPCEEDCPPPPPPTYGVAVLGGSQLVHWTNTSGHSAQFEVENTGTNTATILIACEPVSANVTCTGANPSSVVLASFRSAMVTASYNVGAVGNGTLRIRATIVSHTSAVGSHSVIVQAAPTPPLVSLLNANHDNVDRSLCLTAGAGEGAAYQCGALLVAHGLPPYSTMGRDRAPTLVYTSEQAFPKPTVQALVTLGGSVPVPQSVYAQLDVDINGTSGYAYRRSATWLPWGSPAAPVTRVISLVYGGSNEPTGAHPYRLTVRSQYADSARTTVVTGKLLIVNRRASPFGEGWGLAGLEQILIQSDQSMLWWGGDGSAKLYQWLGSNTWVAPPGGYRDTLRYAPLPINEYYRVLRHGVTVTYNAAGRHIRTTNRTGQTTTFTWNGAGQLTGITVPPAGATGTTYTLQYNATTGYLFRLADPANRALLLTHTGAKLTKIYDPDSVSTWYEYNADGNMRRQLPRTRVTQTTGWTNYSYAWGVRLTRVAIPIGPVGGTDSAITVFEPWDERTTVTEASTNNVAVHPDSIFTRIRGPRANVADDAKFYVDRWGAPNLVYDPLGNLTQYWRENPAVPALVTRVNYPNERIVRMIYDGLGNLLQMRDSTSHLANGAPTRVNTWEYLSSFTKFSPSSHVDAAMLPTGYGYTTQGLPASVAQPNGHLTRFEYAGGTLSGLVRAVVEVGVPSWDSAQMSEPAVDLRTAFAFNALGNVVADTSPSGRVRRLTRDSKQLVSDVYDAVGHRTSYVYDGIGRVRNADEHVTVSSPGFPGDSGFAGSLQTRTRRKVDLTDSIIDARGVQRGYRYDEAGRLTGELDELNLAQTNYLDAAGLVDSVLRRTGRKVRNLYDAAGRLTRMSWEADATPANAVNYVYDVMGQLTSATMTGSTVTRTYTPTGDLLTESSATGTIHYGYDAAGRRQWYRIGPQNNIAVSDSIWYRYNTDGELTHIGVRWRKPAGTAYPAAHDTVRFFWDPLGRRDTVVYSNGAKVKFAYDADGALRLMCSTHPYDNLNDNAFRFTLFNEWIDRDGMIRRSRTKGDSLPAGCLWSDNGGVVHENIYGARHQLLQQKANTRTAKYRYDKSGNMTKSEDDTYRKVFTMPQWSNRLSTHSLTLVIDPVNPGPTYNRSVTYQADGARDKDHWCTGGPPCTPTRIYRYDGLGRTIGIIETTCSHTDPGSGECVGIGQTSNASDCAYDAVGRMSKPCENGVPNLGFDGNNIVRTDHNAQTYGWTIVHGPGLDDPLMGYQAATVSFAYYLTDGTGRQYGVGNKNGTDLSEDPSFIAGGRFAGGTGNSSTFGAERHTSSAVPKVSYFRNRLYDQATGRWTQEDPIGVAGGVNLYQFSGNNPVAYTDPFGLVPTPGGVELRAVTSSISSLEGQCPSGQAQVQGQCATVTVGVVPGFVGGPGKAVTGLAKRLVGRGNPTKIGAGGKPQPFDAVSGRYLSPSSNPGLMRSPLARFGKGLAEGVAESQSSVDGPEAASSAQAYGQALGKILGTWFGSR